MSAEAGASTAVSKAGDRRYTKLYAALACLVAFILASWWSWRYAPLPDPLQPVSERSLWQRLVSPIERNAFRRLPVITGDLNGVYAVKDTGHVWAVGNGGLILHSADGGDTWERQENINWTPGNPVQPLEKAASVTSPFAFIRSATAAESSYGLSAERIAEFQRLLNELGYDVGPADGEMGARTIEAVRQFQIDQKLNVDGLLSNDLLKQLAAAVNDRDTPAQTTITQQSYAPTAAIPEPARDTTDPSTIPEQSQMQAPVQQVETDKVTGSGSARSGWSVPPDVDLHAVAFTDTHHGIAVGQDGIILVTADTGITWTAKTSGTDAWLFSVVFATPRRVVVVGEGGAILVSEDAGESWAASMSDTVTSLRSVAFASPRRAVAVAPDDTILVSTDAGETWEKKASDIGADLYSIAFATPQRAVAVGENHTILVSTDAGESWDEQVADYGTRLWSVAFASSQRVVAVGENGTVLVSVDAGETWDAKVSNSLVPLISVTFVTSQRAVAVGEYGSILVSVDAGETWTVKTSNSVTSLSSVTFTTPGRAVAVGYSGTVLVSDDAGENWFVTRRGTESSLESVAFAMPDQIVAVGSGGTVLVSTDAGESWVTRESGIDALLEAVVFASPQRVVAVGRNGTILVSDDTGETWTTRTSGTDTWLASIASASPQRLVTVGLGGTILVSNNAGDNWMQKSSGTPVPLESVSFVTPDLIVAVGLGGTILVSDDAGETWIEDEAIVAPTLTDIKFADLERAVAVGLDGTILVSQDLGKTWDMKVSNTEVSLYSVAIAPSGRAITVGEGHTILISDDSGETWSPVAYARYPAPLFLLLSSGALLFGLAGGWRAWRNVPIERITKTVTDLFASDRPLRPGERDALGLNEIATGISRFLRNRNTEPPLTIAVTGEWGSGKSSLMGLLYHDLHSRGYRPVWFNAWHHQRGENLLASLYANIRAQGIPSAFTPEGLNFRWNLLNLRARRYWLRLAMSVLIGGLLLMYIWFHRDSGMVLIDIITQQWDSGSGKLRVGGGVLALLAGPMLGAYKALNAFGMDPKKLLGTLAAPGEGLMTAQPGIRYRFARDFKEVTEALRPRTLVIFIDDLDRCAKEHVLEVLETINLLVSAGECYIVLGMSRRWVETCVGLEFKELAAEVSNEGERNHSRLEDGRQQLGYGEPAPSQEDPRDERRRFARQYLEKLINIEVPIPEVSEAASVALLKPPRAVSLPVMAKLSRRIVTVAKTAWMPALLVVVLLTARVIAPGLPEISQPAEQDQLAALKTEPRTQVTADQNDTGNRETPTQREDKKTEVTFIPGDVDPQAGQRAAAVAGAGGLALLALLMVLIIRRNRVETEDSEEFVEALEIMRPWILLGHPTPRLLKRYLNHVRFVAMRQRHEVEPVNLLEEAGRYIKKLLGLPDTKASSVYAQSSFGEPLLVALSALQQARPGWQTDPTWLQDQYGALVNGDYMQVIDFPEAPVSGEGNIENMTGRLQDALTAYNERFPEHQFFTDEYRDREAIASLLELMAGVRTEWHEAPTQAAS